MIILIDTNIIISAVLFPDGVASAAFTKAMLPPYRPVVCDYILDELYRKFNEKFPARLSALEQFLRMALNIIKVVHTPEETTAEETYVRDQKDRPIIRAALNCHADLLLTGDKDFLESGLKRPLIISASEFLII